MPETVLGFVLIHGEDGGRGVSGVVCPGSNLPTDGMACRHMLQHLLQNRGLEVIERGRGNES